jgi:excisionase family DNA binding protein
MGSRKQLLTTRELAGILNVTLSTIYTWSSEDRLPIPPLRVGSLLRFKEEDVDAYLTRK